MRRKEWTGIWTLVPVLTWLLFAGAGGAELPLKDILQKNLEASGGAERLEQVENFAFKTGDRRSVVSAAGDLKLITGKDPVVTEIILVKGSDVRRNSFDGITELGDPQKAAYQTLGLLYAGLFSLKKFEGRLRLEGMKTYGPERLYHLTTAKPGAVRADFFLRADDFTLKRLVFQGVTPDGDKYEVNYDFAPFEEIEGLMIPPSWFISQVGTRGNLVELSEARTNQPLAGDFFDSLEINIGTTEVSPGLLKGNILDTSATRFGLTITTNWRKEDVEKAGLRTGDRLAFLAGGSEFELVFYASARELPPQNELAGGARLMTFPPRGGDTYVIQFVGTDTAEIATKLEPLAPAEIKKK
ncbi:MAG: hypothetical protein FJY81_05725 [Candidatus Aminicenantes bacterium]|nr:hypothetical protein [Candidatus Aminicenantes bacterium]